MSKLAKALTAAAGNAGGDNLYVEDVFSTYLYEGNGSTQTITNGIDLGSSLGTGGSTNLDYDSNEYVYRNSELTGTADVKTFTFSAWIYPTRAPSEKVIYYVGNGTTSASLNGLLITLDSSQNLDVAATNTANSTILNGKGSTPLTLYSWNHILVSIDLSSTGTRKIYINDVDATSGYSWLTYTNDNINFTVASNRVGRRYDSSAIQYGGNVASVFLAHTYTDLTVEANRRKFIDSDGAATTHATVSALSPIVYLPLDDDYASGTNLGTGGSFTSTGSFEDTGPHYTESDSEGGMVWVKSRTNTGNHAAIDTERGGNKTIYPNLTAVEDSPTVMEFNNNGFRWVSGNFANTNTSGQDYASWTFRKAEKFFDVVTYTGTGTAQTIAHNLGSAPAFIIVKRTDAAGSWAIYHASYGATYVQILNDITSAFTNTGYWNDTAPTDSLFSVGTNSTVNASGGSYVAYLFASDAGGYGDDGSESIVKCGSFTTDGSKIASVDCGFEPQWLLVKKRTTTSDWFVFDVMRGMPVGANPNTLYPNQTNAENTGQATYISLTASGFDVSGIDWEASAEYIYIAIRRPMKTPESGTEVFAIDTAGGTSPTPPTYNSGFPVDFFFNKGTGGVDGYAGSRLQGAEYLTLNSTAAATSSATYEYDYMDGARSYNWTNSSWYAWMFKRATGFFDVVAYTGDGSARTINHNLGVAPELMIVKSRSSTGNWAVYNAISGAHRWIKLNENDGLQTEATPSIWNDTEPTASVFSLCASTASDASTVNGSGTTYIAYLFASVDGVSKVGSYTGTGSTPLNVDCGFSNGARFVMIKRADGTGGWYVHDTERGIVAGNDPLLQLNSTAAEITSNDYIDPYSSGFTVSNTFTGYNASGSTYIFLAIA